MSREAHPEVEATTPPTSPSEELGPGAGAPAQSMSEAEPEGEGAPRSSAVLQEANAEVQATTTPTSPSQELGTGAGAPITQQAVALAGGWFRFWDEGAAAPYYYHPEKGTKWEEPPEAQAAHVAQSGVEPVAGSEPAEPGATAGQERYAYHDGYDWDTYASLYGYPSGYHAYWSYYWGGAAASMMNPYAVGPPGYHNPALAGGFEHFAQAQLESYPERPGEPECQYYIKTGVCGFGPKCRYHHPPREEVQKKKADCPYYLRTGTCSFGLQCRFNHPPLMTIPANSHTNGGLPTKQPLQGGSGGGIIYEPPPPLTSQAAGGDAMARLEGVLARAPGPALDKAHATAPGGEFEPHTPEEEPDAELTEAQKIFGVSDTFTPAATVAQIEQRSQAGDVGRIGETDPRHMTAEDIAASARRLEEEASASNAGILIDSKDVRRHGHLSSQVAVEKALLAKVQGNGTPAAEGYAGKASFNVRTGKFEGAGEVHKIAVSDPRRQTSHFFDYDKFAAEKNSKKARTGP